MDTNDLINLQNIELEILIIVDRFCSRYHISYSLYAGTALGAIRHKGFIPWDDDIDLAMTRENFNRFCAIWKKHPVKGYTLSCLQYDNTCGTCHAKVHKDNTVFLSEGEVETIGHHGIWLDIFPFDKVGNRKNQKKVFRKAAGLILISRANTKSMIDTPEKRIVRGVFSLIPRSIRRKQIYSILKWLTENDNSLTEYQLVDLSAAYMFEYIFPKDLLDHTQEIEFNGKLFQICTKYDQMLKILYGDYMQLPPESERKCTHNPVKLQF